MKSSDVHNNCKSMQLSNMKLFLSQAIKKQNLSKVLRKVLNKSEVTLIKFIKIIL